MLVQSLLNCGNSVSLLTVETEKKSSGLGLRCKKPRLAAKRDRSEAKEVLAKGAIKAKTEKVSARGFRRSKPSKTKNRPQG